MDKMILKLLKSPALWLGLAVAGLAVTCAVQRGSISRKSEEAARLASNQAALLSQIEYHRSRNDELVASVRALTLRRDELSALIPGYEEEIRSLRIELDNVRSVSHVSTEMALGVTVPILDFTVPELDFTVPKSGGSVPEEDDTVYPREFSWRDDWTEISGKIYADSLSCVVVSRDSLLLVAHYERRKCLFKKKGRLIKYDVRSRNPHVTVTDLELVDVIDE